jgi:hypothetical protein
MIFSSVNMQLNYSPPVHIYRWVVAGIILIDKDVLAGVLSIGDAVSINSFTPLDP